MPLPTTQDIDAAVPSDGVPVRSLTNGVLKSIVAEVQMTSQEAAQASVAASEASTAAAQAVTLTGAQTIAGAKTFSTIPVVPAANPTTDNQVTRKGYVDARSISSATLPLTYLAGIVAINPAAAVANAVDETDVVAQFNALLTSLRAAGYLTV